MHCNGAWLRQDGLYHVRSHVCLGIQTVHKQRFHDNGLFGLLFFFGASPWYPNSAQTKIPRRRFIWLIVFFFFARRHHQPVYLLDCCFCKVPCCDSRIVMVRYTIYCCSAFTSCSLKFWQGAIEREYCVLLQSSIVRFSFVFNPPPLLSFFLFVCNNCLVILFFLMLLNSMLFLLDLQSFICIAVARFAGASIFQIFKIVLSIICVKFFTSPDVLNHPRCEPAGLVVGFPLFCTLLYLCATNGQLWNSLKHCIPCTGDWQIRVDQRIHVPPILDFVHGEEWSSIAWILFWEPTI